MSTSAAARAGHISLEFLAGRNQFRVRVLERPGLWMSVLQQRQLVADMRRVVASLGIGELPYGLLAGNPPQLDRAILTLVEDRASGAPIAFNAMQALECTLRGSPVDVIHIGLTVVDPRFRARGLAWVLSGFTTFLLFLKNGLQPYWISSVSQVPSAIGMVCEAAADVFPGPPETGRRTFEHVVLARQLMQR